MIAISSDGSDRANYRASQYIDTGLWQGDQAFKGTRDQVLRKSPFMQRLDIRDLPHSELRHMIYESNHIRQRLLLCGDGNRGGPVLSILRSDRRGCFSNDETMRLQAVAEVLLSVLSKHNEFAWRHDTLSSALKSLETIEACLRCAPEQLPRRECEVCARIIYGIGTGGIALDLDIGEQTVNTYRKRAYQRLGISCERELLAWYMDQWMVQTRIQ